MGLTPPPETTVVCQFCSQGGQLYVFPVDPHATRVRCPSCRRSYGALTRFVRQARARVDRKGRRYYDYVTAEAGGRDRLRSTPVSGRVEMRPGRWYTLLWRGDRLMGLADQSQGYWLPVQAGAILGKDSDRLWRLLIGACLLLGALQLVRLLGYAGQALTSPLAVASLVVLALVLLTPLARWAMTVAADEEDEPLSDPFSDPFA